MAAETVKRISGIVSDAAGSGIVGAVIQISSLAGDKLGETRTMAAAPAVREPTVLPAVPLTGASVLATPATLGPPTQPEQPEAPNGPANGPSAPKTVAHMLDAHDGWYLIEFVEPVLIEKDAYGRLLVDVRVVKDQALQFGPRQKAGTLENTELSINVKIKAPVTVAPPPPDTVADRLDQLVDIVSLLPTFSEASGRPLRSGSETARPTSSLEEWIDAELTEVLGQRFGTEDVDAATLDQYLRTAVEASDERGRRVYKFKQSVSPAPTPVSKAAGTVAGAQRSLVFQVEDVSDRIRVLLRRLNPVGGGADLSRAEAARAAVDESLERLKQETQRPGGPIAPRVDTLFTTLSSQMTHLKREFGLNGDQPVLANQEEDVSNIFAIVDTIEGIRGAWEHFRSPRVSGDRQRSSIGPQLIVLERVLQALHEQVGETERAFNAVGLGPADRQAKVLNWHPDGAEDPAGTVPIPLADLLDWIRTLAGEDAPDLLKKSGRLGAKAIRFQAEDIQQVVAAAIAQLPYRRATSSLRALDDQLETVIKQAGQLEPTSTGSLI